MHRDPMLRLPRGDAALAPWLHALLVAVAGFGAWAVTHNAGQSAAIVFGASRMIGEMVRRASRRELPTAEQMDATRVLDAQITLEEAIHNCVNDLSALQGKLEATWMRVRNIDPNLAALRTVTAEVVAELRIVADEVEHLVSRIRRARQALGMMNGHHEGDA